MSERDLRFDALILPVPIVELWILTKVDMEMSIPSVLGLSSGAII